MKKLRTLMLVEGAIFVALAQVLGYLKVKLPFALLGGSVSLLMLPIVIYALRWGVKQGVLAGLVLGILQFMLDGGLALGWQSIIGDYLIAYAAIGLAGLFHKQGRYLLGTLVGCFGRFLAYYVTGATLWAVWMPDIYWGMTMVSPWFYSLLYNISYMLPSTLITLLVVFLLSRSNVLRGYLLGEDLKSKI